MTTCDCCGKDVPAEIIWAIGPDDSMVCRDCIQEEAPYTPERPPWRHFTAEESAAWERVFEGVCVNRDITEGK